MSNTYAQAAASNRNRNPNRSQRQAAPDRLLHDLPLHDLEELQENCLFVDLRSVKPYHTREQRNNFLRQDLHLGQADIVDLFNEPSTQLLRVEFATAELYDEKLALLTAGVPWAAADGALVYGWPPGDAITNVRVSGVPRRFPVELIRDHFGQYGRVTRAYSGKDGFWSGCSSGVYHISLGLNPGAALPAFIDVKCGDGSVVTERLFVHTDAGRRLCYKCGDPSHPAQFCRANGRAAAAPAALWSTLVVPTPADRRPPTRVITLPLHPVPFEYPEDFLAVALPPKVATPVVGAVKAAVAVIEDGPPAVAAASPGGPLPALVARNVTPAPEDAPPAPEDAPPALDDPVLPAAAMADAAGAAGGAQPEVGNFILSTPVVEEMSVDSLATPPASSLGVQSQPLTDSMEPLHLSTSPSMDLSLPLAQPRHSSPELSPLSQRGARSRSPRSCRSTSAAAAAAIAGLDDSPFTLVGNRGRGSTRKRAGEGTGRSGSKKMSQANSRSPSPPSQHISDDSRDGSTQ